MEAKGEESGKEVESQGWGGKKVKAEECKRKKSLIRNKNKDRKNRLQKGRGPRKGERGKEMQKLKRAGGQNKVGGRRSRDQKKV